MTAHPHPMWEEDARRWTAPILFTPEAWATLTESQRAVVCHRRKAVVRVLQLDHDRRFHSVRNFARLELALQGGPDE